MAAVRAVRDQELEMMKQADVVLSYNEVEHSVIASHHRGRGPCDDLRPAGSSISPIGCRP